MNWEMTGAIGELLGAAATLIMLVYISIQVRHARDATQSATEMASASLLTHLNQSVSQDRKLIKIWDLVLKDNKELSIEDEMQYLWTISAYGIAAEGVFQQYKKGMISEELWHIWERGFTMQIGTNIGNAWWVSRTAQYSDRFYNYMTAIVEKNKNTAAISSAAFLEGEEKSNNTESSA